MLFGYVGLTAASLAMVVLVGAIVLSSVQSECAGSASPRSAHVIRRPVANTANLMKSRTARISKQQYESLASFRYELRRYLRYSEEVTREHGVTPLQYQLLLQVKGFPGRDHATVSELAERMQAKHHGIVALITRCEQAGLVERATGSDDRRVVNVRLTRAGETCLERLVDLHRRELLALQDRFFVPGKEMQDRTQG